MNDEPIEEMHPWYKGFLGKVSKVIGETSYMMQGNYRVTDEETLEITELPPTVWTRDYKLHLEKLYETGDIKNIKEFHTQNRTHFIITLPNADAQSHDELVTKFKLDDKVNLTNLVLFDP